MSIVSYDTNAAREKLLRSGWVKEARVMRLLPSTLLVEIEENTPYALWHDGGKTVAINVSGEVLALTTRKAFPDLPVVLGPGASKPAPEIIEVLRRYPRLLPHIHDIERIAGRRWDLIFDTGLRVKLPVRNTRLSLEDLDAMAVNSPAAFYELAEIDFRVPSQFTMRLKDNSEAGRKKFMALLSKIRDGGNQL
jgi:cell division protein FtsQ